MSVPHSFVRRTILPFMPKIRFNFFCRNTVAFVLFVSILPHISQAQEINCTFIVNTDRIQPSNKEIFENMERTISNLINTTQWSRVKLKSHERVNANIILVITEFTQPNSFSATLNVLAERTTFNSDYKSPIFNFQDPNVSFTFNEFQILEFNPAVFQSNIVSIVAFYSYLILGIYFDTLSPRGGEEYFTQARQVVTLAQNSGFVGWDGFSDRNNRFWIIDNWLSPAYLPIREAYYGYHRRGLDMMHKNIVEGRRGVENSLNVLETHAKRRPSSFPLQLFMIAKDEEIASVFSFGTENEKAAIRDKLTRIFPPSGVVWKTIK